MKRTLIALTTSVALATTSITAAAAEDTPPVASSVTQSGASSTGEKPKETESSTSKTAEPSDDGSVDAGSIEDGWSLTGSTPIDLFLIIAGALGLGFVVQQFQQGGFDQILRNLQTQFKLPG